MDIAKLKVISAEERQIFFETEVASVTEEKYMKPLTEDELRMEKEALAAACIAKGVLEQELKDIKDDYKERIEPHAEMMKASIEAIRFRAKQKEGKLYKYVEHESKVVYFIDPEGNVINSRMMLPEERQYILKPEIRQAI